MNFRPASETDLEIIITWIPDSESCLTWAGPKVRFPLELEQLHEAIEFETTRTYALDDGGELLAFGQIRMFDNQRGHLSRIVVNPSSRGKGIGRIFAQELIREAKRLHCRTISLNVVKDNAIAIRLYRKLGFMPPRKQPDNLRENIVYMELQQHSLGQH
jgi:ribosomal protein S18 acetylase RimI-like enzyme